MTDLQSNELLALADRVEQLPRPDRETDCDIYQILHPHMRRIGGEDRRFYDPAKTTMATAAKFLISGGATAVAPRYTASLDATITLVPEQGAWRVQSDPDGVCEAWVEIGNVHAAHTRAFATSPALALTAAALNARAALEWEAQ